MDSGSYGFLYNPLEIFKLGELIFKFIPLHANNKDKEYDYIVRISWKRYSDKLLLEHDELFLSISDEQFLIRAFHYLVEHISSNPSSSYHNLLVLLSFDQLITLSDNFSDEFIKIL